MQPPSSVPPRPGLVDGWEIPREIPREIPPAEPQGTYYPSGDRVDRASQLRETLGLLWQGRWIILAALLLVVTSASAYVLTREPEYEAYSLLLLETGDSPVKQGINMEIGETLGLGSRKLDNEVWFIRRSLALAERVAQRLLKERTLPTPEQGAAASEDDEAALTVIYGEEDRLLPPRYVATRLMSRIAVYPDGRNIDGVRIVASSTEPAEAALIANTYAEEYIARTQEASRASIVGSRAFLEEQETKLRQSLSGIENEIKTYMSSEGAVALDEEASQTVTQIAELEAVRDEARIEYEMRQAALGSLEAELKEIEPRLVQRVASGVDRELQNVQEQIVELELRMEQIYVRNPELRGNPGANAELAALDKRLKDLQARARTLSQQYVEEVLSVGGIDPSVEGSGLAYISERRRRIAEEQIALSGLSAKREVLDQRLGEYEGKLRTIPRQSLKIAEMQRARQATERLYLFIVEKLQETRIAEESELGYAEIVLPAFVPGVPVRPDVRRSLMLAVLFGLGLGVGLVLLRKRLDTRLHAPADLKALGQSVMGVIPDMQEAITAEFAGKEQFEVQGRTLSTALAMLLSPASPAAEAYRRLRTNIQFSRPDTVVQTLLVTSPDKGEGKSTTLANLAIAMAQAGRRTLIVDCDLRRPRQHALFGLDREPGLAELLFDATTFAADSLWTGIDDLHLIPAGNSVPNPTELIGSKKMRDLIALLRESFDIILFDTPPTMAFSDAMLLSTQCDATLVVGAADKTDARAYQHTVDTLEGVGAVVIGGVLNGFDPRAGGGYGYGYGYKYGYKYYRAYYTDEDGKKKKKHRLPKL